MYQPRFTITSEINNLIAKIETIRQKVKDSNILPEQEIALRFRAAVDTVHSSTTIEGNPLNKNQVIQALAGKLNTWEKAVIEVQNYKKALDWIEERVRVKKDITVNDILKLHFFVADNLLPKHKIGLFRSGSVFVVDIIGKKEIVKYKGPEAASLSKLLNDLLFWLNNSKHDLHPILAAGILHYEFVSVHPFSDGNGRVTRLLVKLWLDLAGYDFRGALVLDKYYLENRMNYYKVLNQAKAYTQQTKANLTNWLEFFVTGFYEVAKDLAKEISVISVSRNKNIIRLSSEEIDILDFLKQFGRITIGDVTDIIRSSERTAQRRLKSLINKKLLVRKGQGKTIYYVLRNHRAIPLG
jgi:Fic family protein